MENLVETDLARIKTLNFVELTDCKKLKRLSLASDLSKLIELKIDECPELQELPFVHLTSLERISIKSCKKFKNISEICNVTKLLEFDISEIDEPQELCFVGLSRLKRIQIEKCSNLKRLSGISDHINLKNLYIKECPQLEDLPSFTRPSSLEEIEIVSCAKLQNITLPRTLIYLSVQRCGDLERVAAAGDLTELTGLDIDECPELVDLPSLCTASCLKNLEIYSCDKLKNISLPITLNNLSLRSCRNLERVAAAGDSTDLTRLNIDECPELENSALSLQTFVINGCEKLQSIAGIGELHASQYMQLCYCSNALTKNLIYKLKGELSRVVMTGRAVDGAESILNQNLFIEANVGIDRVDEIGAHLRWSEIRHWSPIIRCFLVAGDSFDLLLPFYDGYVSGHCPEMCQGERILTTLNPQWMEPVKLKTLMNDKRMKKGFRIKMRGEEGRIIDVLRTIVNRLHYS